MSATQAFNGVQVAKTSRASPFNPVSALSTLRSLIGFSLGALLCFVLASVMDARELGGANVWIKPAKFALSFLVLYVTLIWVVQRLSAAVQESLAMRITLATMVVATWTELAYIGARAGLGKHSHFAQGTPMEIAMYSLMGVGALSLVIGIACIGWTAGRDPSVRMGPGVRMGVKWGFTISAGLTLLTAGYLSGNGGHFVGIPSAQGLSIPIVGWSAEVGDLRPAHFLALHAMQALPLVGWWLDRTQQENAAGALRKLAMLYVLTCLAVFAQALAGQPLFAL
jgi:hypothetical protein